MAPALRLTTIISALFEENSYISHLDGRGDCIVVDPGLEPDRIVDYLVRHRLRPAAILITHGHSDHIAGNGVLKEEWPETPIVIGRLDADKLTDPALNLSAPFGFPLVSPPADVLVAEGDRISYAGFDLSVHEIPGHSIGHVVYYWPEGEPPLLFAGDVLFAGSVGRTDFPDGSFERLREGIHGKLFTLAPHVQVLPGHGPATTIGREKKSNPFVGEAAGYRL